jgi:ABC-type Fe3+-hydroxamate transport system substrate-binding protein
VKLISLCPSLTELLFDLGVGDQLVGRTKFCVHPEGRVDAVEKVGGTKNPRIDRIIALQPDLVFMNEEENRLVDARALEAAGLTVHSSLPRSPEHTAQMVRAIGAAVGRVEAADAIARDIESRAERVRRSAEGHAARRFAYLIWREPWMTINSDTFVSRLLELPGGVNVFGAHGDRYPTVTPEEIAAADPALILLSTEPFPFRDLYADELAGLTNLPRDRFRIIDGELLSWHGSRTPRGIDYAEEVIARSS